MNKKLKLFGVISAVAIVAILTSILITAGPGDANPEEPFGFDGGAAPPDANPEEPFSFSGGAGPIDANPEEPFNLAYTVI